MTQRPWILLTNDDGYTADGIQTLLHHLLDVADAVIIAPDRERSAIAHAITMHQPLRVTTQTINGREHRIVNGTPADCVKIALEHLFTDNPPELIISGINRGPNLGNDILYSGTVSAAIEGYFHQIPSIAASLAGYGKVDFHPAATFIRNNIIILKEMAAQTILNLNFPILDETATYLGVRFTGLGLRTYQNVFEIRRDPRGNDYYWMAGEPVALPQNENSDIRAVDEGFVSITPLRLDLTNDEAIKNFTANFRDFSL